MLKLLGGLALLIFGAELAGRGAKKTAIALGVAPLFISLTLTTISTSMPELSISIMSAIKSLTGPSMQGFIFANSVGSMIFQGTLSLGIIGLFRSFTFAKRVKTDLRAGLLAALLLLIVSSDGIIDRLDGILLLLFEILYMRNIVKSVRKKAGGEPEPFAVIRMIQGGLFLLMGIVVMIISSKLVVDGAVDVSFALGLSEEHIGMLTGYGTSFPELFFSIAALFMGMENAAIGNLIGSNSYIITAPIGIAALMMPQTANVYMALYAFVVGLADYFLLRDSKLTKLKSVVFIFLSIPFIFMMRMI